MSRYSYVIRAVTGLEGKVDDVWLDGLATALADIDARLSKLEAAQKALEGSWKKQIEINDNLMEAIAELAAKPKSEPAPQREPGLYPVELENGLFKIRRWTSKKCWVNQSGYTVIDASDPVWIGPRIPEPSE